MPDLLALEFESNKVLGIDAQVSPTGVRIRKCFELEIPESLDLTTNPTEAGEWLKQQLKDLSVQATQAVATLPREIAVARHIAMPDVPDEELPELVKFQAGLKSALPLDQLALDFLPLPQAEGTDARDVLITTVPKQALQEIKAITEAAGLQVITAGLSPVSAAEVALRSASHSTEKATGSLVVTRHGPRVEISILKGANVVFSHFTQIASPTEADANPAIIAAIARSMMGLTGPITNQEVTHAWLIGSQEEFGALAPALEKRLNPSVQILDPFETTGVTVRTELPRNRSAYSALVGSLLAQSQPLAAPVDYLAPRRPPVKPNHARRRAIIGTAAAACLALAVGGTMYFKINKLNKTIAGMRADKQRLDELAERGEPILQKMQLLDEWTADRQLWLDEMAALNRYLPPTDRAFFNQIQFNLGTGNNPPKISLDGFSRERGDAIELGERIIRHQDQRYGLFQDGQKPDDKDPYHPWKFDMELLLNDDAPAVKLTTAKPKADSKTDAVTPKTPADAPPSGPAAEEKTEETAS